MRPKRVVVVLGFDAAVQHRHQQLYVWGYQPEALGTLVGDDVPAAVLVSCDQQPEKHLQLARELWGANVPVVAAGNFGDDTIARLLQAGMTAGVNERAMGQAALRERLLILSSRRRGPQPHSPSRRAEQRRERVA